MNRSRKQPPAIEVLSPPAAVVAKGVSKTFPGAQLPAVDRFDIEAHQGEVLALLGPSGCGKTTALRMIAGLERPDTGRIEIAGRTVFGEGRWIPTHRRSVGMVFQDYALFPHLSVRGNIGYGLDRLPRSERRSRIDEVLRLTGLHAYAGRHPHELSGGQQQRVAIARAIAPRPAVVLLDEPFSNLDVEMREQVRGEVLDLLRDAGVTVILVTHDQDEAFVAAGRIAVMSQGSVHQVGTAEELYYGPKTRFVAQFVGIANWVRGERRDGRIETPLGSFAANGASASTAEVLLRPEQIEVAGDGMPAVVAEREFHGHDWLYVMHSRHGDAFRIIAPADEPLPLGADVYLRARVGVAPAFTDET